MFLKCAAPGLARCAPKSSSTKRGGEREAISKRLMYFPAANRKRHAKFSRRRLGFALSLRIQIIAWAF